MTEIPDGWHLSTIGEVAEIVRGVTYSKADTLSANDKDAVPLLRATNLEVDSIDFEDMVYVPKRVVKAQQYLKLNDIFLAASSGSITVVGKSAQVVKTNGETFGAFCAVIRPKEIHPKYLSYWVQSPEIRDHWSATAKGTNINNLKPSDISGTKIPIPPIVEQHKIVELLEDHLSRLDAALADVRQAKIKSAQFRRSLIQFAFRRRLVDEQEKSNWTTAQLSDLADIGWGDLRVTKKSYVDSGYVAYSATGADGFLPYFDYDSEGIIVSAIGANCGRIFKASGKWSCIKNTMRILPKNSSILIDYLFHYLSDSTIFPKRGSGQPFIGQQDAREIEISFPSVAEQQKIIDFVEYSLSRLDLSMKLAEQMENQAVGLRRSLLHAAFTGQLTKEVVSV